MSEVKISSIVYENVKKPVKDQATFGTWSILLPTLMVAFVVLKVFIYIKDDKRHGK